MNKIRQFIKWFHENETPIIRAVYIIPIIFAAFVSINHVIEWYSLTNPHSWAIYLSIGIEIAALSALAGMVRHVNKRVYLPFGIVTLIQIIGNIFYSYQFIDENGHLFKTWLEISGVLFTFETNSIINNKLIISLVSGGLIPIISLSFLHLLVSFNEKEEANKLSSNEENVNNPIIEPIEKEEVNNNNQITDVEEKTESVVLDKEINENIIVGEIDNLPVINKVEEPEPAKFGKVVYEEDNVEFDNILDIQDGLINEVLKKADEIILNENVIEDKIVEEVVTPEIIENIVDNNIEEVISDVVDEVIEKEENVIEEDLTLEPPVNRHTSSNQMLGQLSIQRISDDKDEANKFQKKRVTPNKTRNN